MTLGCHDDGSGTFAPESATEVIAHCEGASAVLLGSGIGRSPEAKGVVGEVVRALDSPLVIDADALSLLGPDLAAVAAREAPTVLTPHAGEMGRMLGVDAGEVEARRIASAVELAEGTGATVVLKGDDTVIRSGNVTAINDLPSPALATAGTGDVLAGVITAFLARGVEPLAATAAAVISHSRAGRVAADRIGLPEGVVASDVISALPEAIASFGDSDRGVE
jgi:NAD(P)H-hydrate epimerase